MQIKLADIYLLNPGIQTVNFTYWIKARPEFKFTTMYLANKVVKHHAHQDVGEYCTKCGSYCCVGHNNPELHLEDTRCDMSKEIPWAKWDDSTILNLNAPGIDGYFDIMQDNKWVNWQLDYLVKHIYFLRTLRSIDKVSAVGHLSGWQALQTSELESQITRILELHSPATDCLWDAENVIAYQREWYYTIIRTYMKDQVTAAFFIRELKNWHKSQTDGDIAGEIGG